MARGRASRGREADASVGHVRAARHAARPHGRTPRRLRREVRSRAEARLARLIRRATLPSRDRRRGRAARGGCRRDGRVVADGRRLAAARGAAGGRRRREVAASACATAPSWSSKSRSSDFGGAARRGDVRVRRRQRERPVLACELGLRGAASFARASPMRPGSKSSLASVSVCAVRLRSRRAATNGSRSLCSVPSLVTASARLPPHEPSVFLHEIAVGELHVGDRLAAFVIGRDAKLA